jgi:hypothetical protein
VDRFLVNAIAFVDDMHREQSRERTRDAMRRKAAHGHVAGGAVYAYRNVRRNGHVEREIVPEEAEVVRRLFREIVAGRGYLKIAQHLNVEGIAGPWGRTWAGSSIRAMIFRELYRRAQGRAGRVRSLGADSGRPGRRGGHGRAAKALCGVARALGRESVERAAGAGRLLPERLTLERAPSGIRVTGMAAFGPLMAGIAFRQAMVPPG